MMFDQKEYHRQYRIDHRNEKNVRDRQSRYRAGAQPMAENRLCASFLGVHIAERVLSQLFKRATRMPYGTPGFDFKCANGYMVDSKASCSRLRLSGARHWHFGIRHNPIADYFLCMAFDNREDLNPLHIWLIPGKVLSHLDSASISETTLDKWAEYEKPLDKVMACCDTMRGDHHASG